MIFLPKGTYILPSFPKDNWCSPWQSVLETSTLYHIFIIHTRYLISFFHFREKVALPSRSFLETSTFYHNFLVLAVDEVCNIQINTDFLIGQENINKNTACPQSVYFYEKKISLLIKYLMIIHFSDSVYHIFTCCVMWVKCLIFHTDLLF